jgi:hypothetical protein
MAMKMKPSLEIKSSSKNKMIRFLLWCRGLQISFFTWPFIKCGIEDVTLQTSLPCEYCGTTGVVFCLDEFCICKNCMRKGFNKVLKKK